MFETLDKPPRPNVQIFLGFLLGVVASLACLFLTIFLPAKFAAQHEWVYPAFNAIALIGVGIVAYRQRKESNYAVGALIALSLALLLDGACAIAFFR